jgi:hypothetical protein
MVDYYRKGFIMLRPLITLLLIALCSSSNTPQAPVTKTVANSNEHVQDNTLEVFPLARFRVMIGLSIGLMVGSLRPR